MFKNISSAIGTQFTNITHLGFESTQKTICTVRGPTQIYIKIYHVHKMLI